MTADYKVEIIPIFENNYVFIIVNASTHEAIAIDPGEASNTLNFLKKNNLDLIAILITHHHADHIGGLSELKMRTGAKVYAPLKNKEQISDVDQFVCEKDLISASGLEFQVLELPGHTLGHVAFWSLRQRWLFSGDVLFGLGCGRLFEGSYSQMYLSLQKIKQLPADTLVYCTHEYTEVNIRFCNQIYQPENKPVKLNIADFMSYANDVQQIRKKQMPSIPLHLKRELSVNPFLLAETEIEFKKFRELRNKF